MQLYLLPVIVVTFSLLLAGVRNLRQSKSVAIVLTFFVILSFIILITFYKGVNSDWQTYREFVGSCDRLGCTYFEPGFDLLTFLSAETFGFGLIKATILIFYIACLALVISDNEKPFVIIVVVASVSVAALPLMLGAVRQMLSLPLLLLAAIFWERQRYLGSLLAITAASALHYSGLVVGIWYGIFWFMLVRNMPSRIVSGLRVLLLILCTYAFFYMVTNTGLGEAYAIVARVGETGVGTDSLNTGGLVRDILIFGERLPFAVIALMILTNQKYCESLSKIEQIFLLMYIAGTIFFISLYGFDRNIAGRTLATFRVADLSVIVTTVFFLFNGSLRRSATISALGIAILFLITKSYMTLITVGFFDE